VPGYRLLVHPPYQTKEYPVFTLNERVIVRLATPLGACVLVLVAGWGVGNITLPPGPSFPPRPPPAARQAYDPPRPPEPGGWLATFELGSTVILLTEPARAPFVLVARDDPVRYGQPVFGTAGDTRA